MIHLEINHYNKKDGSQGLFFSNNVEAKKAIHL